MAQALVAVCHRGVLPAAPMAEVGARRSLKECVRGTCGGWLVWNVNRACRRISPRRSWVLGAVLRLILGRQPDPADGAHSGAAPPDHIRRGGPGPAFRDGAQSCMARRCAVSRPAASRPACGGTRPRPGAPPPWPTARRWGVCTGRCSGPHQKSGGIANESTDLCNTNHPSRRR